ncbi:MAG TPA: hypothetical protein VIP09_07255, partial [Dehalococcoidia bacterium]
MIAEKERSARPWLPVAVVTGAIAGGIAASLNALVALALLGVILIVLLLAAPFAALPLIIAASALDRFGPHWGDANVRLDLLAVLLVAAALANR